MCAFNLNKQKKRRRSIPGWPTQASQKFLSSFFFFWPQQAACGILVPQPGIEPRPMAVKAGVLISEPREFPAYFFIFYFFSC